MTATRGELGTLGTGGLTVEREELGAVREAELRAVLDLYGAEPPIILGYRDQELKTAAFDELVSRVLATMDEIAPDVVITFGPTGISGHEDHIAIHRAAVEAFHRYRRDTVVEPRLFFVAIPEEVARRFEMELDESELTPTTIIDVSEQMPLKVQALKTHGSQEDAQEFAEILESEGWSFEAFHQAYPPHAGTEVASGFW